MKKKIILFVWMASVVTTIFPIHEQERDILYTMHTLEKDFAEVDVVVQNIDMFISIFQLHADLLTAKLTLADQKLKKVAISSSLIGLGVGLVEGLVYQVTHPLGSIIWGYTYHLGTVVPLMIATGAALNVWDAFKARNVLRARLATDTKILEKLFQLKEQTMFSFDPALLAEDPIEGDDVEQEMISLESMAADQELYLN